MSEQACLSFRLHLDFDEFLHCLEVQRKLTDNAVAQELFPFRRDRCGRITEQHGMTLFEQFQQLLVCGRPEAVGDPEGVRQFLSGTVDPKRAPAAEMGSSRR